jgi:hypothetical protein
VADLHDRFGLRTDVTDRCLDWLASRAVGGGGRDLVNVIERDLINPLAHFLFARRHQLVAGRTLLADVADGPGGMGPDRSADSGDSVGQAEAGGAGRTVRFVIRQEVAP